MRGSTVPLTTALRPARTLSLRLPTPTFAIDAVGGWALAVPWFRSCAGVDTAPVRVIVVPSATAVTPVRSGDSLKTRYLLDSSAASCACGVRGPLLCGPWNRSSPARGHLVRPRLGVAELSPDASSLRLRTP